jgi:hypothetical protein
MLVEIINELNRRADAYQIGGLQRLRKELRGFTRVPTSKLFSSQTTFEDYAFHHGGRSELQFNVGYETIDGLPYLRHGVAFSLEASQTLPDISVLFPRVRRFNEFLRLHPDEFGDLRLWHYRGTVRSADFTPSPVPPEWVENGVFICLGRVQLRSSADAEVILRDFDRLLPLYEFVQGDKSFPELARSPDELQFRTGWTVKPTQTVADLAAASIDIALRHNLLQAKLCEVLTRRFGRDNVGVEILTGVGTRVDAVVLREDETWFYEIKTALAARACIREAMAQLVEYAYWPDATRAHRLIVVGEPTLDDEAESFLRRLRTQFSLPIFYQQLRSGSGHVRTG